MKPELEMLKTKLRATWTAGDFSQIAKAYTNGAEQFVDLAANTQGDDRRVLKQQEQIRDSIRPSFLDQFTLKFERLLVSDQAHPANFELAQRGQDTGCHFAVHPPAK